MPQRSELFSVCAEKIFLNTNKRGYFRRSLVIIRIDALLTMDPSQLIIMILGVPLPRSSLMGISPYRIAESSPLSDLEDGMRGSGGSLILNPPNTTASRTTAGKSSLSDLFFSAQRRIGEAPKITNSTSAVPRTKALNWPTIRYLAYLEILARYLPTVNREIPPPVMRKKPISRWKYRPLEGQRYRLNSRKGEKVVK